MSDRPADTITRQADYLWWLLPAFLKNTDRTVSMVAQFCEVWGEQLDDARETLSIIIPELLVATASGDYLDILARQRQVFRGVGESDESLRTRVLAAHTIKRKGGTIPGMEDGLAALGFESVVWEFIVDSAGLMEPPEEAEERDTFVIGDSYPATWDDWEIGETSMLLDDNGDLDDSIGPMGEFEGHENDLVMWRNSEWLFLTPFPGQVVKNRAENIPFGALLMFDGDDWNPWGGDSIWSHFIIQVIEWDGEINQDHFDTAAKELKPAHTLPFIAPMLSLATWDDWEIGEEEQPLDTYYLDDWQPSL